jgi:polysaccharide deacetylase 2 family uncharacterized protein YibQ
VAALLFGVGAWFGERLLVRGRELADAAKARPERTSKPAAKPRPQARAEGKKAPSPALAKLSDEPKPGAAAAPAESAPRTRIAIVIDDLGRDRASVDRLLALGVPFAYAVLPFEPSSFEIAEQLRARGAELLLHLPMEPKGKADPGPGAVVEGMSAEEVANATRAALDAVPGVAGVNNHMGSAVTADRATMEATIRVLEEKGLFFLDSRTSADSVGYQVAREAGVATARRDLFLDEVDERGAILAAIDELVARARERGAAIGIAHPRRATLAAFEERIPQLAAEGVEIVPVSYLLERVEAAPE